MSHWTAMGTNALAAAVAVVLLAPGVGAAQTTQAPAASAKPATATGATSKIPRTPWGDPDFQGTWTTDNYIGVPIQRPADLGDKLFLTEAEWNERAQRQQQARQAAPGAGGPANAAANTGPPDHWGEQPSRAVRQTSFVIWPADGRIPAVTPEGQKRAAARDTGSFGGGPFNTFTDFTNFDRCITRAVVGSIMPRPYGNGLDIVQAPGYVALSHEMIHEARIIPIDAGPHLGSGIRQYMGDSRGRWEGDTLVVETTNFTDRTSIGFNGNGLRHSEAMRHVERFRRVDADTIEYEVTIEDPKTYTAPFKIGLAFATQPGYQVFEYACHEGNYGMTNILSGARADEAAAKK